MVHVVAVFALSAALAAVVTACLRARASSRWGLAGLLGLGVLPVALLYLYSSDLRVVSSHGFLHTSIVYRLLEVGVPPDCPLFAHEPLLYPWAHHGLVALLSLGLGISPAWSFAVLNVVALAGTLAFAYRLGAFVGGSGAAGTLAAVLSVYGTTFLNYLPLFAPLEELTGLPAFGLRNPVVMKKFSNLNSNSLGYFFFAMVLFAATRLFSEGRARRTRADYLLLGLGVAGAAFFYPISWLGIGVSLAAMAGVALWRRGAEALPTVVRAAAVAIGASLLASPYLLAVTSGKSQQMFLVAPDLGFLLNKLLGVTLALAPVGLLSWWQRDELSRALRVRGDGVLYPAATGCAMAIVYVVLGTDWNTNEYKFLGMTCFATGIVASISLGRLYLRRKAAAFLVLTSFLLAAAGDIEWKLTHRVFPLSDPYREEGMLLRHRDPAEDVLYRWLRANTTPRAMFVDDRLTIPMFAQRALYVGLDSRGVAAAPEIEDGWHIAPDVILGTYYAYSPEQVARRTRIATTLLAEDASAASAEALATLREDAGGELVFLIARTPATLRRFDATAELERVFQTTAASVYTLAR